MNNKVAIITPVGNEIDNISDFYKKMIKVMKPNYFWVLVFDSYCTDGTYDWMLSHRSENIHPINIGRGKGVANAYIEGYKYALNLDAEKLIEVDVGHPVELISKFEEALDRVSTVFGTRYHGGKMNQSLFRKIVSIGGTLLAKIILKLPYSDCTSGLQGARSEVIEKMDLDNFISKGHFYQTEFKYYCKNLSYEEVPFVYNGAKSSLKKSEVIKSFILLIKLLGKRTI